MNLNENLYELRRKAGLSQEELADKIGVSRQAVGKWENAAAVPELDKLIALSEVFGVGLGELLGLESPAAGEVKADTAEIESLLRKAAEEQEQRAKRYENALAVSEERAQKQRKWLWAALGAAGVAVAVLAVVLGGRIARLNDRVSELQSNTIWQYNSLSNDISRMQGSITEILRDQASLFSGYNYNVVDFDQETGDLTVRVSATPKSLTEGTQVEFVLTEAFGGGEYRAEGTREGLAFTAELRLPPGTYELTAVLEADGVQSPEVLSTCYADVIGLAAEYYYDWLKGPDHQAGMDADRLGQHYRAQGLLAIWCDAGAWSARALGSVELILYKNEVELTRLALDVDDPANWYETYEVPEAYLSGGSAQPEPTRYTASENGLLFAAEFDFGPIEVTEGDITRVDMVVTDALGLVYRMHEGMEELQFGANGSLTGSGLTGHLDLDYDFYLKDAAEV